LAMPEQRFVHHAELPFQGRRDSRAWERDSTSARPRLVAVVPHYAPLVVSWPERIKRNVAGLVAGAVAARVLLPKLR
jgi:hypothetical protein